MKVSSLLNMSDDEEEGHALGIYHASTPKKTHSFPGTPLTTIPEKMGHGSAISKSTPEDRISAVGSPPAASWTATTTATTTADGAATLDSDRGDTCHAFVTCRKRSVDVEEKTLAQMRRLDLDPATGLLSSFSHHRCSESQSSLSSYASSASEAPSSISSVASPGDAFSSNAGHFSKASSEDPALAAVRGEPVSGHWPHDAQHAHAASLTTRGRKTTPSWGHCSAAKSSIHSRSYHLHRQSTEVGSSIPVSAGDSRSHKRAMSAPGTISRAPTDRRADFHRSGHQLIKLPTASLMEISRPGPLAAAGDAEDCGQRSNSVGMPASRSPSRPPRSPEERAGSICGRSQASSSTANTAEPLSEDGDTMGPSPQSDSLKCMYTENCDTGAQPRKVITHFFGRNKACTMMIPPEVWVHYCRKHYQRVRYRNFDNFPLVQIDLVRSQVERIQAWSKGNQQSGRGRYVRGWTLALRKREQKRLGAQRSDDVDEPSSVPQWVRHCIGEGHTSEQIMDIVDRLRAELLDETLESIPDIEFLPDIVGEMHDTKDRGPKGRKPPKRKASHSDGPVDRMPGQQGAEYELASSHAARLHMMGAGADKRPRLVQPSTSPEAFQGDSRARPTGLYPGHGERRPSYVYHAQPLRESHSPGVGDGLPRSMADAVPRLPSISDLEWAALGPGHQARDSPSLGRQLPPVQPHYSSRSSSNNTSPSIGHPDSTWPRQWRPSSRLGSHRLDMVAAPGIEHANAAPRFHPRLPAEVMAYPSGCRG